MIFAASVTASGTKMPFGEAGITAVLGYAVVFIGLGLLLALVWAVGKFMASRAAKAVPAAAETETAVNAPKAAEAPGSAGEVKLYGTSPREAAMIMAIVADKMGRSVNELRFISIKEVK